MIQVDPTLGAAYQVRDLILMDLGRKTEAISDFEAAKRLRAVD